MQRRRVQALVHGRVQGVAFREYTRRQAVRLGLSGWVRNRPDGTVETVFEGPATEVDELLAWLANGSPHARVVRVEHREEEPTGDSGGFHIEFFP